MYRIFIIEDDFSLALAMKKQIEAWGHEVRCVRDFQNVLPAFVEYDPHLVLVDIMLPFFNGYHWCSEIRRISEVPVIFLSSVADNMNIVMAMNMGGDDFIAKPVDLNVMTAKMQALLRRTYDMGNKIPVLEHRGAVLNLNDTSLVFRDQRVELTKNEFRILQTLMEHRGKVVSRETLMTKHVAAAFPLMAQLLALLYLSNTGLYMLCTLVSFLVFTVFYVIVYLLTARTYYRIVSR